MSIAPLRGLLAGASTAAAAWFGRRAIRARFEDTAEQRADPSAIVAGAEPVSLDATDRGVLILHGFGDTPQSVRALATVLHRAGWTVRAPLLRGHGASLRAFTEGRAEHWLSDARNALDELRTRSTRVAVVGQSMGGALATILASEAPLDALVLLAPYFHLSKRARRIAALHRIVSPFVPYLRSRSEYSILDPEARSRALGRGVTTPRLLHELSLIVNQAWMAASDVRVPTLMISSRRDPRVANVDAEAGFARLASSEKVHQWADRSGHVLTVDFDRDWVAREVLSWLDAHTRSA